MRRYLFAIIAIVVMGTAVISGGAQHASGSTTVVVKPSAMNGWYFWNDKNDTFTGSPGALVAGPATPPQGTGSVRLGPLTDNGATAAGHSVIATDAYFGTPLANFTTFSYSTFQPGPILAIALQFDVRYRTADTLYGGRLVFEPYQNGTVTVGSGWQSWSPLLGKWWATKTTAAGTGGAQVVPLPAGNCAQSTPCTWAQINAAFPAAKVQGRFLLKAGSNWNGFDGNADSLTVGVSGTDTNFDFEPEIACTAVCYVNAATGNDAFGGDTPASAKKTIQAAASQVSSGGAVNVAAGTYDENVVIATPLTLTGAGQATTIVRPAVSNPNCGGAGGGSLCAGGSNILLVQADNVTIQNLGLDGDNTTLTSAENVGGANIDARNGIITNHGLGVYQNLTVLNTTVKNVFLRGMYASSGGTFNFHDNTVQNVQANPASIAMFNFGGAGTFANNTVSAANDAISSNHSRGVQFLNNVITNSGSGIHTDNAGDGGGTADLIQGNTISNSPLGGYGIFVFVPYIAPTFQGNTVTNVDNGIAAFGQGLPVTTSFIDNVVDAQSKANSIGAYITTDQLGFGDANVSVLMTGNIIKNHTDGVIADANTTFTTTINATKNFIAGNGTGASKTVRPGTNVINMTANWWGSDTGPSHVLNTVPGTGNSASDGVVYSPWLGIGTDASPSIGFQLASPMTWIAGPAVCGATCIQAAIDYSANGDTVKAKTGVFPEHVIVNKSILLTQGSLPIIDGGGSGNVVTITAPNVTVTGFEIRNGTNDVVVSPGANNATVTLNNIHNFTNAGLLATGPTTGANFSNNTVTGPHLGSCVGGFWGVKLLDVSGSVNNNVITGIGNQNTGCQEGRAIEAGGAGTVAIGSNNITLYQKSGIIIRGTVNSNINLNTTANDGPSTIIAANGITITSTGTTSITNNNTSGHAYTPSIPSTDFSCGILLYNNTATVSGNTSTNDQVGICAIGGNGTQLTGNNVIGHRQQGINIDGAANILVDNNIIDGQGLAATSANPGTSPDTDTRYYGVFAVDSTGTVSNNVIKGIKHGLSNGIQSGVGIRLSARSGAGSSNMTISGNNITDIQKNAMVITNAYGGASVQANVTGNTVVGNGPINYIAQNGIQVSGGAGAVIANNDASGYDYTPSTYAAIGILIFGAGPTSATNNIIHNLMEGMYVENTNNAIVSGNTFTNFRDTAIFTDASNGTTFNGNQVLGQPGNYGLYLYAGATNNIVTNNAFRNADYGVTLDYSGGAANGNTFSQNCIAGNTIAGMATIGTQTGGAVSAQNNWWGKVNGADPAGHGDKISPPATINAVPFLTAPVAGCPVPLDGDGDGLPDATDNCPTVYNPDQKNVNGETLFLPKPFPSFNDKTNPSADNEGDACDPDIDGDGVLNTTETSMGLSPYIWDTDGDRTNDGTEILCGSDPLSAASNLSGVDTDHDGLPDACEAIYGTDPNNSDTDGDGLNDGPEVRYWMSNPLVKDTDADGCSDAREVATVDGNRVVNSADLAIVANSFGKLSPEFRPYDTNGDGFINAGDLAFIASKFGPCQPT